MPKRSANDLALIANAGGGFTLNAAEFTRDQLAMIAAAASKHGARIHIENCQEFSTNDLALIANAGKGSITFDL